MLSYVSVGADVLASLALLVSVFFLLKEMRLTQDSIRHSDFVNSINRSAENMLCITENEELLRTIDKVSVYRNHPHRSCQQLRRITERLTARERLRYFHFQRNACLGCEVFLESADAGSIDTERFSMAFGWDLIDLEIWTALDLDIGKRTWQRFGELPDPVLPLHAVSAD